MTSLEPARGQRWFQISYTATFQRARSNPLGFKNYELDLNERTF